MKFTRWKKIFALCLKPILEQLHFFTIESKCLGFSNGSRQTKYSYPKIFLFVSNGPETSQNLSMVNGTIS